MRHVIAALVQNEPGVLAHVAGMFAARGFNIDSLVVGRTESDEFSRMTIVVSGDDRTLDQVRKQLSKLVEVVKVVDFTDIDVVERDLMLVRVQAQPDQRQKIIELATLFRAKIVDVGRECLTIELAGTEDKLIAFVELLEPYGIVELARTGLIAMPRSERVPGQKPVSRTRPVVMSGPTEEVEEIDPKLLPPG